MLRWVVRRGPEPIREAGPCPAQRADYHTAAVRATASGKARRFVLQSAPFGLGCRDGTAKPGQEQGGPETPRGAVGGAAGGRALPYRSTATTVIAASPTADSRSRTVNRWDSATGFWPA